MFVLWCVGVCLCVSLCDSSSESSCVQCDTPEHGWQNPKWDHGKGRAQNPRATEGTARLHSSPPLLFTFTPHPAFPRLILVYLPYLPFFSSCPTFISAHPWPLIALPLHPFFFSLANVLGSERIKEAGRETPNDSWASALAWCGGLKNLASWCWFALDTHSLFLLSLSVHIEWLPGSVKGTGRQRSPTSKPSPLAVFSHTIRLQTHIHTHTHMHMLESRKASQKASLEGWNGIGKREKIEAKINVGMRWNEESE